MTLPHFPQIKRAGLWVVGLGILAQVVHTAAVELVESGFVLWLAGG